MLGFSFSARTVSARRRLPNHASISHPMPESTIPTALPSPNDAPTNGGAPNGKSKKSPASNGNGANGNGHSHESSGTVVTDPDEIGAPELEATEVARVKQSSLPGSGSTGWTPGFRSQTAPDRALKFARHFTQSGQDPFSTSQWEHRTASITGENGKSVFEQKDCEIPAAWSQLATNVVVSKYFRGPMNTPQRETSVRQVIGRVADTIGDWGKQGGYFASEEDGQAFRDELVYLLLHQYGAFNSPVWFNLGVKGARQQASACQPYDALVSTPSGLVPIGELVQRNAVGTKVFDAHGVARIVAVKNNGVKIVLRVHTKAGYTLDVTADHLVWKATGAKSGQWVEGGTLKAGDCLQWHRTPVVDKSQELSGDVSEAALAGWLQSDGFVGRYQGTNRSLTMEAIVVNAEEEAWVRAALEATFSDVHSHTRNVETQNTELDCKRIRVYGEFLAPFIEKWGLMARRHEMRVPSSLFTAPLSVVAAYLRSLFQAEGYVCVRDNAVVGIDMMGEEMMRGVQKLLLRFGIYSRLRRKEDARPDRAGMWSLGIRTLGDRELFAQEIGFISQVKATKLARSLELAGLRTGCSKRIQIEHIEVRGEMPVFDIQTSSGEYLSGNIRVHNCFINSVYDDMESIMELAATEARLFKGGSGAGTNLFRIRSSREQLSGGGIASGPVSFMRGWDAFAGAIKSGGTTRRAAKMVILNADHPDIAEFITCKANEEKKAWALIDAGYNGGFNVPGGAYDSVAFQNANHSVRVTDEFMRAAENGASWSTRAVTSGAVVETLNARDLLHTIAETTHICGDPGLQYDTTLNDWHTCPNTGRINASNPCSEFVFLDDTACNLASINLLKFYDFDTGHFDARSYVHTSETFLTAQEIIVSFASYPTAKIAENSELFRPLGLGYCNIGALLMAMGLAYDSDEGRAFAGALTAIMTGAAYRQSAKIARNTSAFEGYALNREPMLRVIGKHRDDVGHINSALVAPNVMEEARSCWDEALLLGQKYGYRNSQVTVLAPTGTISFMMDADTTGVEPDIALVKYKKLVGGGLLKIVNQTVPAALRKLGYDENEIATIVEYIDKNDTIEGAPGLEDRHLSVFDCAFKAMNGVRSIHHMGHVKMMAAAQPFLSGAISKTVNMPQDCTVDEIRDAYIQSWKMGVKAVAIYRDNSKRTQPLSTSSDAQKADKKESEVRKALRRKLPDERMSITHKFSIAGQEGYFMVGLYEDGSPGEIFIKMSKEGSTISGLMDSFAVAISMCLQYGVPLRVLVNKFSHTRFEPSGYTTNRDIPIAKSLMDYIFRWFDQKFHPNGDNGHFGKVAPALEGEVEPKKADRAPAFSASAPSNPSLFTHENGATSSGNLADAQASLMQSQADSPPCPNCGAITVRSGACYKCNECGTTTGCG